MSAPTHTLTPDSLVIANVATFWQELRQRQAQGSVEIDLSQMQRVDTAGLQLLHLAANQGSDQGITVRRTPPAVAELVAFLGLPALRAD